MIDDLAYEIGHIVIGVALMAFWFGGPIAGGDYIGERHGKRAGDWFGAAWFLGWPLVVARS